MKNQFMFLSFLPAFAYWYLESNYPLHIALMGGLGLAVAEIVAEKIFFKTVHKISLLNFYIILILGSLSLMGDEGIWFKLQPCLTGLMMGGVIFYFKMKGKSLWYELMVELKPDRLPPAWLIEQVEKHLAFFMITYGVWMGFVAYALSTSQWLFFKTAGFYLCFLVFLIIEMILLRRLVKRSD